MNKLIRILLTTFAIIFILLGFALPLNPPNGFWYQQFFPDLNGRTISDITFADSLTGYACTRYGSNDTNYILRSTNRGDNWNVVYRQFTYSNRPFRKVQFLNRDTGYCGGNKFLKTINAGLNWDTLPLPYGTSAIDFHVLSEDTLWFTDDLPFDGGIYRSTDKGITWLRKYDATPAFNPERIYMYNGRIGFMSRQQYFYKTTTSGDNWFTIPGGTPYGAFLDIYFIDSLTGWKCDPTPTPPSNMKKTSDGGLNWVTQTLPSGGIILTSIIGKFSVLNRDTIWGAGGQVFYGGGKFRGMIYRTINGGDNWLFQVPDTSFGITSFGWIRFINKNIGWVYGNFRGIHTTNGGDTTFLLGVKQVSSRIPKEYELYQNYPNPFNPVTIIKYVIMSKVKSEKAKVNLIVFDVIGREIIKLVNQKQNPGTYEVDFSGTRYSSGIYFYTLIIDNILIDTKKMILIK